MNRKTRMTAALLSASVLAATILPISALAAADTGASGKPAAYAFQKLSGSVSAEVKSVLCDRTSGGTRIAAVVRLKNNGTSVTRVPDFDLHAITDDGINYKLAASAGNLRSMQPKEEVELSFLLTVNRNDSVNVKTLTFVQVNEYVYPKQETLLLSEDVSGIVWQGDDTKLSEGFAVMNWGQGFQIPGYDDGIVYTPVSVLRENGQQGLADVVTLVAENTSQERRAVPDFRIGIDTADGLKSGGSIDGSAVMLDPGEKHAVHVAVPLKADDQPRSLLVMSPESFIDASAGGQAANVSFSVGRLQIQLPDSGKPVLTTAPTYTFGKPIAFDPLNQLIGDNLQVSLVELHLHENAGDGYKTAVAKFKITNRSNVPVALPAFGARLSSVSGFSYDGVRQSLANQTLMPNLSYVVDYSFALPSSEDGQSLKMTLLDSQTTAAYGTPIASMPVAVQTDDTSSDTMHLYPFDVKLDDWSLSWMVAAAPLTYSYKLKMDLEINRSDEVVVDSNFSKLRIELSDSLGRVVASQTESFVGTNRLVSGIQQFAFNNITSDQQDFPLTMKLYEVVDTPNGEAKRLLKTLQQ